MRLVRCAPFAALILVSVATHASGAQTLVGRSDSVYTWHGTIPASGRLTLRNFNGPIDVRPAAGNVAELRAVKQTGRRGGRITDVAFQVRTSSNGDVSICSTQNDDDEPCDDGGRHHSRDDWHQPVTVAMTVLVPRGVSLHVATGNGEISVNRAGSDVHASTGNGRVSVEATEGPVQVATGNGQVSVRDAKAPVHVSTGNGDVDVTTANGPVEVSSGNGNIDVRITSLRAKEDMSFGTGSGSVRLTLPANFSGELDASTGNGTIRSDFDLKVKGRLDPRHVRATIGDGGPMLRMSTGNGEFEIRKS